MTKLHFNYKDMFRAFRLGFSAKKIWVGFVGLFLAWLGYSIMGYLAHFVSGTGFAITWESFRLLPLPFDFNWAGWLLWSLGTAWFVIVSMIAGIAITKLTYEQLRGDEFYEVKEAWKQAIRSAGALVATPFLLALTIVFLLAAGLLLGLFGLIPYAGEIIIGVFSLPAFAVALCIVYLGIVLIFTFTMGPAVIGTTKCDAFDNLFEIFSCVNDQPWRLVWYRFLVNVFSVIGMAILAFASFVAIMIAKGIVGVITGQKLFDLFAATSSVVAVPDWLWWIGLSGEAPETLTWSMTVGMVLLSITARVIVLFILAYGMAIICSGNTLIYLVLVRKKDERNLLEVKEEEIEIPEKLEAGIPPIPKPEEEKPQMPAKPARRRPAVKKKITKG